MEEIWSEKNQWDQLTNFPDFEEILSLKKEPRTIKKESEASLTKKSTLKIVITTENIQRCQPIFIINQVIT